MHIIKRYQNRKLYDTHTNSYVTLEKVADYVQRGEDIQIIDNDTGNDLTAQTLTHIIFANKHLYNQNLPISFLTGLIRLGDRHFWRTHPRSPSLSNVSTALANIATYIDDILIQGDIHQKKGANIKFTTLEERSLDDPSLTFYIISALLQMLVKANIPTKEDINQILDRLDVLEAQIEALDKTL